MFSFLRERTGVGVELRVVEVVNDVRDLLDRSVPEESKRVSLILISSCLLIRGSRIAVKVSSAMQFSTHILKLPPTKNLRAILKDNVRVGLQDLGNVGCASSCSNVYNSGLFCSMLSYIALQNEGGEAGRADLFNSRYAQCLLKLPVLCSNVSIPSQCMFDARFDQQQAPALMLVDAVSMKRVKNIKQEAYTIAVHEYGWCSEMAEDLVTTSGKSGSQLRLHSLKSELDILQDLRSRLPVIELLQQLFRLIL